MFSCLLYPGAGVKAVAACVLAQAIWSLSWRRLMFLIFRFTFFLEEVTFTDTYTNLLKRQRTFRFPSCG
jgi:hypothetical protein